MEIIISKTQTDKDTLATYYVMRQLRNNINQENYVDYIKKMMSYQKQYTLITAFLNNKCVGVVGFSYDFRLSVGKMIYIEDLVVDESHKNLGIPIDKDGKTHVAMTRLVVDLSGS